MTKIFVKINQPKSQVLSDEDDDEKIKNAMRFVDKNIGNLVTNSRGSSNVNLFKKFFKINFFFFRKHRT